MIPSTETADLLDRGDGFDLDLAKVMLDVSAMPALISPIKDSEVPPSLEAAEYAAPATPGSATVIKSPGYSVPEELTFTWVPEYVPVPEAVAGEEGGQTLSPEQPPPSMVPASPGTPVVNSGTIHPDNAVAPEGYGGCCKHEECATDREGSGVCGGSGRRVILIREVSRWSRHRSRLDKGGTFRCERGRT